ncbi:MAG: MATE family efflux transporter [Desulfurococcaceae archaeon]
MSSHYIVLDKYRDEIVSGSVVRVLFKIGLPLMLFNIVMLLYNIADAYWLSRYSQYAVSIPRQSWPVLMLFNAFIMSFSSANMAIISQYIGARMYDRVNSTVSYLFTLNLTYSLLSFTALNLFVYHVFKYIVRTPEEIFFETINYVRVFSIDVLLNSFVFTLSITMQCIGDTRTPARVQIYGVVLNAILDPFLINGFYSIPSLGAIGAALASVISRIVSLIILYVVFIRKYSFIKIKPSLRIDRDWFRLTIRAGLPIYAMQVSNMFAFVINHSIINSLGIVAATAFAVGFLILDIADNVLMGFTQAATVIIGQNLGAGNTGRSREIAVKSSHILFLIISIGSIFVYFFRRNFIEIFVKDSCIVSETDLFVSLSALTLPFFGLFFMGLAVGRGSGYTLIPTLIGITRLWIVRIFFGYHISIVMGMGTYGYWLAITISNFLGGLLAYIWIRYGKWNKPIIKKQQIVK